MYLSERNFEETIEAWLLYEHGYRDRHPNNYDRDLCLDPEMALAFVQSTQPQQWEKLRQQYGEETRERFLNRLASEIEKRGALDVLRSGIRDVGAHFRLVTFRPSSGLNPDLQEQYRANIFSVIRQLKYHPTRELAIDMGIFLNGLPIFTVELKNHFTNQTVEDAIRQYKRDRDPRDPPLAFKRCLAHFAVDNDLAYETTHLKEDDTVFLPFNQGRDGGAGNPPRPDDFASAYLWQDVWAPDSILNLLQHFIHVVMEEKEDERGRTRRKEKLIFPRYHQLDTVRRLVESARYYGTGYRYLIAHSAGSGKSNSIAWLAHQLSILHDDEDRRVFDTIIVVSDRRVIDRQLQEVITQFEQTLGVVETIGEHKTSRDLKKALERGKDVIVTTLQKFPVIVNQVEELGGQRFAVIIDEAHSSQGGESAKSLRKTLRAATLDEAAEDEAGQPADYEDLIIEEMRARQWPPNVSFFAFTATPKAETLELFGTQMEDGSFEPFSLYSMRQAIEEGFIRDVLENYTTYRVYWNLLKTIADDPRYDRDKANYLLKRFVDLHPHAIDQKVAIMIEHFDEYVASKIDGHARAMIVTRSRLHAVRYKLAVDAYLRDRGLPYRALVAFTGTVHDPDSGLEYTEARMNGFPERQTKEAFNRDESRILIVAEKFQTGFDQPLLHTMYVDKRLRGVHAVQTLSRLNRTYPGKEETMVLDFANDAEDILASFEPYYEGISLAQATDPNQLYDLQTRLENYHLYMRSEVDYFAGVYFDPKAAQAALHSALDPVVERFNAASEDVQSEFRGCLKDYIRQYAFLSQVITFTDADLERLYVFARLLRRKLPVSPDELPVEIQRNIEIDFYRIQQTHEGSIKLPRGKSEVQPRQPVDPRPAPPDEEEMLSQIIKRLNEYFGLPDTAENRAFVAQFQRNLADDPALENSARANTRENTRLTFNHVAMDKMQDMYDVNFQFYKRVNDDEEFARSFFDLMFDWYLRQREAA